MTSPAGVLKGSEDVEVGTLELHVLCALLTLLNQDNTYFNSWQAIENDSL